MDKKGYRELIKQKRSTLDIIMKEEFDRNIRSMLLQTEEYKSCIDLFIYISIGGEVDTHEIINKSLELGKKVFVPKVNKNTKEMNAVQINSIKDLVEVPPFNILEPKEISKVVPEDSIDLIIMPGLAFSKSGDRLGYGGGYYDKFLKHNRKAPRIALAYEFQIFDSIPIEVYDEKVTHIISERSIRTII
ncbi:5-formyltetrahydrofolate cyclo-ligase [Clostridium sp. YIM B02505]|uniref:5-formyltetrahydrofolate cyclo-ligase n=1 Tax=Clostridium yunnanense TaxID=2800325 RepID=A0ABS1ESU4_9CLOT|nr:5-formyltetrahydrofolate cyclo-ligase [Clostridium yunnanense]MBK1812441.1 5-formyltetrahydrofolate cyclo-ligase [Clostridium yunnanense]